MPLHSTATAPLRPARARRPDGALYRIVWRWHFYAGLICLPVLVLMALTGGAYLFREEINDAVFRHWRIVDPADGPPAALSAVVQQAQRAHPGTLEEITLPAAPGRSVRLLLKTAGDDLLVVYADPRSGQPLGAITERWQWETIAAGLHSLELLGRWANIGVEIVAGWAIVLIVTGTYLWWPRGRRGGVLSVRGAPHRRLWWRDLHAVTGALAGVVVLFLAATGMPWSAVWGQQFGAMTQALGLGLPAQVWNAVPLSTLPMSAQGPVPWTFEHAKVPRSDEAFAHQGHDRREHDGQPAATAQPAVLATAAPIPTPIGIDQAARAFAAAGVPPGFTLRMPSGPQGAYTALVMPHAVQGQRVVHLDQYSGKLLADIGYADYGAVAKVTEWGISVHKGTQYGLPNQLLMLAGCVAVLLLAVSSVVMWWKRRPAGSLAAPARRADDRVARHVLLIAALLGLLLPTLGISMLAAVLLERAAAVWRRRRHDAPA
jgi:uncharacterized iron-regulated membrane protein